MNNSMVQCLNSLLNPMRCSWVKRHDKRTMYSVAIYSPGICFMVVFHLKTQSDIYRMELSSWGYVQWGSALICVNHLGKVFRSACECTDISHYHANSLWNDTRSRWKICNGDVGMVESAPLCFCIYTHAFYFTVWLNLNLQSYEHFPGNKLHWIQWDLLVSRIVVRMNLFVGRLAWCCFHRQIFVHMLHRYKIYQKGH